MDGAVGTELARRGWRRSDCLEAWAVEHCGDLLAVHRDYVEAGAELILTCTLGANRRRLREYGLSDQVERLNRKLAKTALEAADGRAIVAGDIGPLGADESREETTEIFSEQVTVLMAAGVDLIMIETMTSLEEAISAVEAVCGAGRKLQRDIPVLASLVHDNRLLTRDGHGPAAVFRRLSEAGASAIGVNCMTAGAAVVQVVREMRTCGNLPVFAKPSAGLPRISGDGLLYPIAPDEFAGHGLAIFEAGASMVGGCCGTTPAHIAALVEAVGRAKGNDSSSQS
jgi:5-methyltetrahydrofolate--homocysteine methyltransferase